ncbi:MAG: hypothetical protein GY797_07880 [Deltaproteobacteria bacterium]|nr:hypothetical protein [Deltaproteobacteria bacterium]
MTPVTLLLGPAVLFNSGWAGWWVGVWVDGRMDPRGLGGGGWVSEQLA